MKPSTVAGLLAALGLGLLSGVRAAGQATGGTDRLAAIAAKLAAGDAATAAQDAQAFLREAKEENAVTEARRLLAEALRKAGRWREAATAYKVLATRYPKESAERLRAEVVAEVLATSRNGVYLPDSKIKDPPTLADDAALEAAILKWAKLQSDLLGQAASRLRRARIPQAVVKTLLPLAERAQRLFGACPDAPPDGPRTLVRVASAQLDLLAKRLETVLQRKLDGYQPKMDEPWTFTNIEKREIAKTSAACQELVAAEAKFQELLEAFAGAGEWEEGLALKAQSATRQARYRELASAFKVPDYDVRIIWGW